MNDSAFIRALEEIDWLAKAGHISSVLDKDYDWEWLPTSRDQENPYPVSVPDKDRKRASELATKAYKAALVSLRKMDPENPLLIHGTNNYSEAFKGAALYCVRLAAKEAISGKSGKWIELLEYFKQGRWPCGVDKSGSFIVL